MTVKQGDVIVTKVFFPDTGEYKMRPVVVVANDKAIDLYAASVAVTSQAARDEFDVPIEYWKEAGLHQPSVARVSKPLTIHLPSSKKIGTLHPHDLERVLSRLQQVFS